MDGCKLAMTMGASYVARWTTAHPVQLEKAIREGMKHRGFAFIEVLCQCPVQAGKGVYGEKEPAKIMKYYKDNTYQYKKGMEIPEDKIRIGTLKHDKDAREYIERIDEKLISQGIKKG